MVQGTPFHDLYMFIPLEERILFNPQEISSICYVAYCINLHTALHQMDSARYMYSGQLCHNHWRPPGSFTGGSGNK